MYDARLTVAGILTINPRKADLKDGCLVLLFRPRSLDAQAAHAWYESRLDDQRSSRDALVEFKRRRVNLVAAHPATCRIVKDRIGRERLELIIRYDGLEER